jgi:hypothetical protein
MKIDLLVTAYPKSQTNDTHYVTFGTYNEYNIHSHTTDEFITIGMTQEGEVVTIDLTRQDWEMVQRAVEGTLS